jgi:hypothetical protein
MFDDIESEHINSQDGLRNRLHVYGTEMPAVMTYSDYGDVSKTIMVIESSFNTIEGVKNHIKEKLSNGDEVYIYCMDFYVMYSPTTLQREFKYLIRMNTVGRWEWDAMIREAEHPTTTNTPLTAPLFPWAETNMVKKPVVITVQPDDENLVRGKIKRLNF